MTKRRGTQSGPFPPQLPPIGPPEWLWKLSQDMGEVKASSLGNRQAILDLGDFMNLRFEDLKGEMWRHFQQRDAATARLEKRLGRVERRVGAGGSGPPAPTGAGGTGRGFMDLKLNDIPTLIGMLASLAKHLPWQWMAQAAGWAGIGLMAGVLHWMPADIRHAVWGLLPWAP